MSVPTETLHLVKRHFSFYGSDPASAAPSDHSCLDTPFPIAATIRPGILVIRLSTTGLTRIRGKCTAE
jgi:hypothetical protein